MSHRPFLCRRLLREDVNLEPEIQLVARPDAQNGHMWFIQLEKHHPK